MIEEIFKNLVLGLFVVIGFIFTFKPDFAKKMLVKYYQHQYDQSQKMSLFKGFSEQNLEMQKSKPLSSIRLTGIFILIFMAFILFFFK